MRTIRKKLKSISFAGKEFIHKPEDCFRFIKKEKQIVLDTNRAEGYFLENFETGEDCNNRWNQLKLEELIKEIELIDIASLRKSDKQLTQAILKLKTLRGKAVDCVKDLLANAREKEEEIARLKKVLAKYEPKQQTAINNETFLCYLDNHEIVAARYDNESKMYFQVFVPCPLNNSPWTKIVKPFTVKETWFTAPLKKYTTKRKRGFETEELIRVGEFMIDAMDAKEKAWGAEAEDVKQF